MYTQPGKMIKETQQTKYVVKVRGVAVSAPQPSQQLAEAVLSALPPDQRLMATIVPVTTDGKEMLFE